MTSPWVDGENLNAAKMYARTTAPIATVQAQVFTTVLTLTSTATRSLSAGSPATINTGFTTAANYGDLTVSGGTITVTTAGLYVMPWVVTCSTVGTSQFAVYPLLNGAVQASDTRPLNSTHTSSFYGLFLFPSALPAGTTIGIGLVSQDIPASAVIQSFGVVRLA